MKITKNTESSEEKVEDTIKANKIMDHDFYETEEQEPNDKLSIPSVNQNQS